MIYNTENSQKLPIERDAWKLQEDKINSVIKLAFKPGEEIEVHRNPLKVIFYVLKGRGSLIIESKDYKLSAGDLIEVEGNANRGWKNDSEKMLEVLVIKQMRNS